MWGFCELIQGLFTLMKNYRALILGGTFCSNPKVAILPKMCLVFLTTNIAKLLLQVFVLSF
jgi:hypothetical protein